jgi:hypothetical protein
VRGALIKHHPDALVMATRSLGAGPDGSPILAVPPTPFSGEQGALLFHIVLPPDILLAGFRLPIAELRSAAGPWWILIGEHPCAPRFGLDFDGGQPFGQPIGAGPGPGEVDRNDLTWGMLLPANATALDVRRPLLRVREPEGGETTRWGAKDLTAAGVARVLLQNPFRAAWRAAKLLPQGS